MYRNVENLSRCHFGIIFKRSEIFAYNETCCKQNFTFLGNDVKMKSERRDIFLSLVFFQLYSIKQNKKCSHTLLSPRVAITAGTRLFTCLIDPGPIAFTTVDMIFKVVIT